MGFCRCLLGSDVGSLRRLTELTATQAPSSTKWTHLGEKMPRITIVPVNTDGGRRRWTLSERIVADNLHNDHSVHQLVERLSWATADSEDRIAGESRPRV